MSQWAWRSAYWNPYIQQVQNFALSKTTTVRLNFHEAQAGRVCTSWMALFWAHICTSMGFWEHLIWSGVVDAYSKVSGNICRQQRSQWHATKMGLPTLLLRYDRLPSTNAVVLHPHNLRSQQVNILYRSLLSKRYSPESIMFCLECKRVPEADTSWREV